MKAQDSQTTQARTTNHHLTEMKTSSIIETRGFTLTGYVLANPYTMQRAIIELSAVRWLSGEKMQKLMHPNPFLDEDQRHLQLPELNEETFKKVMDNHTDITGAADVEVVVDKTRGVLHVNVNGACLLRICRIKNFTVRSNDADIPPTT